MTGQLHAPATSPPDKESPVPTEEHVGWASEPAWTLCRRGISLAFVGNQTMLHSLSSLWRGRYTDYVIPVPPAILHV